MNTKQIVQGAMIAALYGALSLMNTYTGSMFDIFICYGMVVPLAWYGYHYDMKSHLLVSFVVMVVILITGVPFFIISSLSSCLMGLFIGWALRTKAKKEIMMLGTFLIALLNNVLIYEVFAGLLGMDIISEMSVMYQQMITVIPELSQSISLERMVSFVPLVFILLSLMEMYIVIMLCQLIFSRLHIEFPGQFHIAYLHIDVKVGYVLAIVMFASYVVQQFMGIESIYVTYLYLLSSFAFALQGLSFVTLFLTLKNKRFLICLAFLGFLIPIFVTIYTVIGILDIFSDLRGNLLYNRENDEKGG